MPENFEFAYPLLFLALPLPWIIFFLLPPVRIRSSSLIYSNYEQSVKVTESKSRKSSYVRKRGPWAWLSMSAVWLCLVTALASPQLVGEPELKVETSRNFLILADLSFSMAQNDWILDGQRVSRWQAVKSILHEFVDKREGDRMGLVFFASNAYIQAPFTADMKTIQVMLEEADVGMAGQMTNIGKAIVKGIDLFERDSIENKVMLLMTDGVDSGEEILPLDAADLARKDSTIIYTLGIGNATGGGSDLDERTLKEIAEMTDGSYFKAASIKELDSISTVLDQLEPIEYEEEQYKPKTLLFYYPIGLGLIIGIVSLLINNLMLFIKMRRNK